MARLEKEKLAILSEAVRGFSSALSLSMVDLNDEVKELVNNGKIQKFEYCVELLWKNIKIFLFDIEGIDIKSPKAAIKEFYATRYFGEQDYLLALQMIDDRNLLSHIYRQEVFSEILGKLDKYCELMGKVVKILRKQK